MATSSRRSRASALTGGALKAAASLHRFAPKHAVRFHGTAVTTVSCVGAIALYLTFTRRGRASPNMRALSSPLRRTAVLLTGIIVGLCGLSRRTLSQQRRSTAATAAGSGLGVIHVRPGHTVRRVLLPPRALSGHLDDPEGLAAVAPGQGGSPGTATSQAAKMPLTPSLIPGPLRAPAAATTVASAEASAAAVMAAVASAVAAAGGLPPAPAATSGGVLQGPGQEAAASGPPLEFREVAALRAGGIWEPTGAAGEEGHRGSPSAASAVEGGEADLEVHVLDLSRLPGMAVTEALRGLAARRDGEVLGLDAEWEPEMLPGARHRISVLQLATARRCWILRPDWSKKPQATDAPEAAAGAEEVPEAAAGCGSQSGLAAPGTIPDEVVRLLTDPQVIKAGVGIQEDVRRLERDFGVRVRGAVDVRLVAQQVASECLAAGSSLRALTASLLGRLLDKSAQRSHWGAGQLDEHQIAYAAHDAWLSRELLCELYRRYRARSAKVEYSQQPHSQGQQHDPSHHLHEHPQQLPAPLHKPGPAAGPEPGRSPADQPPPSHQQSATLPTMYTFSSAFMDAFSCLKPKRLERALGSSGAPPRGRGGRLSAASRASTAEAGDGLRGAVAAAALPGLRGSGSGTCGVIPRDAGAGADAEGCQGGGGEETGVEEDGAARRRKERKLPTRKSVLYENCRLLAPDGAVLCTCGAKKVRWYIERGLARVIAGNPTTIQLNFEPRGRGHADDAYYLADKENRCCVCGSEGEYLRHSVVPHCYRQHFPTSMKSHLSHDIVLMCPGCHKACSVADQRRMEAIGAQYGAPLGAATAAKFLHDTNLGAVRSAGRALANTKVVIPDARRRELEDVLRRHFGAEEVDEELVRRAANVDPRTEDVNWRSHAELVVRNLGGREQLEAFVRGWRRHFLATMRPRFLPPHWRVDARVANSAGDVEVA